MKKGKVLIIIREFVPYTHSLGSSIRVLKMAEFLLRNGIAVHLLAARGEEIGFFGYEDLVTRIKPCYVDDMLQRYLTRTHKANGDAQGKRPSGRGFANLAKKAINEISIPDEGIYFVNRYVKHAMEIINKNDIRNVIVSSPAHSAQVVGMILKKRLGNRINWIVDYRDSWNTTKVFMKKTGIPRFLSERLEKRILETADHFVCVTKPVLEKLNARYFDMSGKSMVVMNGYDFELKKDHPKIKGKNKVMTIGHFGFISDDERSYRNPDLFFRALMKMERKINLVMYGSVDISRKWRDRLKDCLQIHPHVSHREAIALMQEMDLLMQLHSDIDGADEVISGKIYEYILAEKPILVIGPGDMGASRFVREENLGYCMDLYDERNMVETLGEIHDKWQTGRLMSYDSAAYHQYSRQHQYSKLLEILE